MQNEPNFSVGVFYNTNRILSGSIERSKTDLEKFKRRIRRCKIEFLQIGGLGKPSAGGGKHPVEIGLAVWPGQSPKEDRYLRKMGPTIS